MSKKKKIVFFFSTLLNVIHTYYKYKIKSLLKLKKKNFNKIVIHEIKTMSNQK